MAGGGPKQPEHGLTETLYHISPMELGPLNVIGKGTEYKNFRSGTYFVTTPKNDMMRLYRLYGGVASDCGQYWSTEQRSGNEGYRHDMAVEKDWGNTLQNERILCVPKGTILYEGPAGPQRQYLGGGWQVFIPNDVVKPLLGLTNSIVAGNEEQSKRYIQQVNDAQSKISSNYCKKYVENHLNNLKMESMKGGNLMSSLPLDVKTAFSKAESGSYKSDGNLPTGTYKVHKETIRFPNGQKIEMCLSKRIEFVRSSTRTYTSGKTTIVETTNYYRIVETWG